MKPHTAPQVIVLDCAIKGGQRDGKHLWIAINKLVKTVVIADTDLLDAPAVPHVPQPPLESYKNGAVERGRIVEEKLQRPGVVRPPEDPLHPDERSKLFKTDHAWERTQYVTFGVRTYTFGYDTSIYPSLYDADQHFVPGPARSYMIDRYTQVLTKHFAGSDVSAACAVEKPQL